MFGQNVDFALKCLDFALKCLDLFENLRFILKTLDSGSGVGACVHSTGQGSDFIKIDEFCITIDEFWFKNDEFNANVKVQYRFNTKFIILNTEFTIFNAEFVIFYTKSGKHRQKDRIGGQNLRLSATDLREPPARPLQGIILCIWNDEFLF